jgi:Tfp pilus assembly protein PilF
MDKNKEITVAKIFKSALENHQANKIDIAQNLYNQVLVIDPTHNDTLNNLGVIFQSYGDIQKAKLFFEKTTKLDPNHLEANNNLGKLYIELEEYQKAKKCHERVIEINPNYIDVNYNLGIVSIKLGEYQKAKNFFEKEIKVNPNNSKAYNNLAIAFIELGEFIKAEHNYKKALMINPDSIIALSNLTDINIGNLNNCKTSISLSYKSLKLHHKKSKFLNNSVSLFRLKHDFEQANYLSSKNHEIDGIDKFLKVSDEILSRKENKNNLNRQVLLNQNEINDLLPFFKSDHVYKPKKISGSCINPNNNWLEIEDEYFNSSNQIMYIDDFLSENALIELREFCLVSKVWNKEYNNKYLGAFSNGGFISPIHLQIIIDLKEKLPKLFGPHRVSKIWGFKYDSRLGKGINIHADAAIHNLNFWITPDKYNNNKNSGGLKIYDAPAPDHWTFKDYNNKSDKIYKFLEVNNANYTNIAYKFNRAALFNSAYFHETDEIDFKDEYAGRRINNTYLFGARFANQN